MSEGPAPVRIRRARPEDVPGMHAIYAPIVEHSATSFEETPPSEAELGERLAATGARTPWLVCVAGDEAEQLLGYAYAGPFRARPAYRWTVETTVYVHGAHRRRGVGRALLRALLDLLRLQGFHLVIAGITLPNVGSVRLHEALGFEPVGAFREVGRKLGAWHDVGFWQLRLEAPGRREEPRALDEVLHEPEAERALESAASRVR